MDVKEIFERKSPLNFNPQEHPDHLISVFLIN